MTTEIQVAKLPAKWRAAAEARDEDGIYWQGHSQRMHMQSAADELDAALAQDRASQAGAPSEPVGVEVKVLARDVHYAIRDAGLAPESPADDAAMRDAILRTLAQQPAAVGVPDGWRLVPVAPTQRMIYAMANNGVKHREWVSDVYAAMLAAAPTPAADTSTNESWIARAESKLAAEREVR